MNLRAFVLVTEPWCLTLYKWLSHSHIIAVLFLCLRLRLTNGSFHQKKQNSDGYIGGVLNATSVSGAPCSCAHNAKEESASGITTSLRSVKEADVPRLHNLAMAIIDYKGYRAVVQSVLPGTLQGDKSDFFSV